MLEAATCTLLSCNIAWHSEAAQAEATGTRHEGNSSSSTGSPRTYSSLGSAVQHAMAALDAVQPPAALAAPAFQVHAGEQYTELCCTVLWYVWGTGRDHGKQGYKLASEQLAVHLYDCL